MKYHLQLLKKYLSLNVSTEDIAQNLILKTCEIEEIEERKLADTVVIGKVESFKKHPDADKLNVCQVNCGDKGNYQIVCGGENIEAGIYVPVALVGTNFEKLGMTIAKRAVRGVDSEGMICAKSELGIQEDQEHHWIWNLGLDLEVADEDLGVLLKDKFPWIEATILEVDNKSLTNRPDLTGHFAAAIELNAIYPDANKQYGKIKDYLESFQNTNILDLLEHSEKKLDKQILCQSDAVNSYVALALKGIEVKASDFFTRLQLIDLGGKPVNNWVDFSNLFMNISGQPIHFFDADKIKGNLILREAYEGEKFIDLFDQEHILQNSDLVIADEEKILALAGIIGGKES